MKQKILFISKNYPPKIGGLETYSYNLIQEFERYHSVHKIVLSKPIGHLLWFLPYCLAAGAVTVWKHSISRIHLCDGLLAPIGVVLKLISGARLSVTIHGLDITYRNAVYQYLIPRCVARLDRIVCVSRATRYECLRRGVPASKCVVIPNGIRPGELYLDQPRDSLRRQVEKRLGCPLQGQKILLTVGRLVKRKGVNWFLDNVLPSLSDNYIYIIAGEGPELGTIREKIRARKWHCRVLALGRVTGEVRKLLFNAADIFIMPNISVAGDMEGFGIAILEAGSCGLPVVASDLQGIRDAVIEGETGYLVEEGDACGFCERIVYMNLKRRDINTIITRQFDWAQIYHAYRKAIFY